MSLDFYQPGALAPLDIRPSRITVTLDCTKPGVSPIWQAEFGAILEETSKLMLTDKRIPRVIRDEMGQIIGSINIT